MAPAAVSAARLILRAAASISIASGAVPRQGWFDHSAPRARCPRLGDKFFGKERRFLLYQYRAADAWPLLGFAGIEKFDELLLAVARP